MNIILNWAIDLQIDLLFSARHERLAHNFHKLVYCAMYMYTYMYFVSLL